MTLSFGDFFEAQKRFAGLSHSDQIIRTGWYIHEELKIDRFDTTRINALFKEIHVPPPPSSVYLPRLAGRRPAQVLRDRRGYCLEGKTRRSLSEQLGQHPTTVMVSQLLQELANRVTDPVERIYLEETMRCYKAAAFRAAIVMAWNLAFDHLRRWLFSDPSRVDLFNAALATRYPKLGISVKQSGDLDDIKESIVIDGLQTAKLISKDIEQMLREKLRKRNSAAHPSSIQISQPQADDVITDLTQNLILAMPIS